MFGEAAPVISYATDNTPKNLRYMVESAKKLLFAFLAMEQDSDNFLHKNVAEHMIPEIHDAYRVDEHGDIELRDSTWFTSIIVNHSTVVGD